MKTDNNAVRPYGSWESPISADMVASSGLRLSQPVLDGDDLYWIEGRPAESGRQVIVRSDCKGVVSEVLPKTFNARTLVHEYGGGAFSVRGGIVVFSNFSDQRIYKVEAGKEPVAITEPGPWRYADFAIDLARRIVICVKEDHSEVGKEALNSLISVPLDPGATLGSGEMVVCGCDFFSNPRVSPDGRLLAWVSWNHPNLPWDGCELWIGHLDKTGMVSEPRKIAGSPKESIFQPEWLPNGSLVFVSDRSGFWNLYLRDLYEDEATCIIQQENDFGTPAWVFGMSTFACASDEKIVCTFNEKGLWKLAQIELNHDSREYKLTVVESDLTEFGYFTSNGKRVCIWAGGPSQPASIVEFEPTTGKITIIKASARLDFDSAVLSTPKTVAFATDNGEQAYAFVYLPNNPNFKGAEHELPPLLVKSHGGPTGAASSILSLSIQYWTSRGFAVADVNYGGSAGFGRAYRQRLNHNWGVVDVHDCENAAKHLAAEGLVDSTRMAITGGSAGGYTTLCALTFGDTFKAGASHFGVSDAELLALETHKFESRYGDTLFGPYPAEKQLYFDRSPINFTDRLSCPVIFFQGLEDKVVLPNQAEMMVDALKKKGLPVAYIAYEGEQHGFRKAENIKRTIEAEFYFYSQMFGFKPADKIEPVHIENLSLGPRTFTSA